MSLEIEALLESESSAPFSIALSDDVEPIDPTEFEWGQWGHHRLTRGPPFWI